MFERAIRWLARRFQPEDPRSRSLGVMLSRSETAGVPVNPDISLRHATVWACVRIISETISALPWHVHQRLPDGGRGDASQHPADFLLSIRPNREQTPFNFRETMLAHVLLHGNAYAEISRDGQGHPTELWIIPPDRVVPLRLSDGSVIYEVRNLNRPESLLGANEMLHVKGLGFDGLVGYPVIEYAAKTIGVSMAAETFAGSFFANGTHYGGFLKYPGKMTEEMATNLRESIKQKHGGPTNANRLGILEDGMEFVSTTIPPDQAQFLESRKFQVTEIARWFRVPPHKLADLERATFCLPADAEVYTEEGPRRIVDVRAGDMVWSRSASQWIKSRVVRSAKTGCDPILTIKTTNRTLKVNANHRILVREKVHAPVGGPGGYQRNVWKNAWRRAADIQVGEVIVALNRLPGDGLTTCPTRSVSEGFAEFCGLLIGDGNVMMSDGISRGATIARASDAPYMDHYRMVMRRQFVKVDGTPIRLNEGERQTRFSSRLAADELTWLGLSGNARTKRIPGWVFRLTSYLRLAFLRGFLDADGSVDKKGRISFSSCNKTMLSQIRHLCMGLGIPVTNLRCQEGETGLPNGKTVAFSQWTFTCCDPKENRQIGSHTPIYVERMRAGRPFGKKSRKYPRYGGRGFRAGDCEISRIVGITTSLVQEPVYDLEIEGTHNFIADGVVVHNSNIEQQSLDFVSETITPWVVRLEQEANAKLLGRRNLFTKINLTALLRADSAARSAFYKTMASLGALSINEIRSLEDMNPIGPDGDARLVPMNMQPLDRALEEPEPPPPQLMPGSEEPPDEEEPEDDERDGEQESASAASAHHDLIVEVLRRQHRRMVAAQKDVGHEKYHEWLVKHKDYTANALNASVRALIEHRGSSADFRELAAESAAKMIDEAVYGEPDFAGLARRIDDGILESTNGLAATRR